MTKKKVLILFSGTSSFQKIFDKYPDEYEYQSLDINDKFNPTINEDILTWDYKKALENWVPDYKFIHASPVCKEFLLVFFFPKNWTKGKNNNRFAEPHATKCLIQMSSSLNHSVVAVKG